MSNQRGTTDEPMPPEKPAEPDQDESAGLNPDGADVGMGEPDTFEPEEG